jgi:hypothetical protein
MRSPLRSCSPPGVRLGAAAVALAGAALLVGLHRPNPDAPAGPPAVSPTPAAAAPAAPPEPADCDALLAALTDVLIDPGADERPALPPAVAAALDRTRAALDRHRPPVEPSTDVAAAVRALTAPELHDDPAVTQARALLDAAVDARCTGPAG